MEAAAGAAQVDADPSAVRLRNGDAGAICNGGSEFPEVIVSVLRRHGVRADRTIGGLEVEDRLASLLVQWHQAAVMLDESKAVGGLAAGR